MGVLELGKQLGIAEASEQAVVELALAEPGWGQVRAANELKKQGVFISPAGVRCVWLRHDLENINKRLKALETKSQQDGLILSESQVAALEKAKRRRKLTVNSKVNVRGTVEHRILSMSALSREWAGSISRPLSTPTAG